MNGPLWADFHGRALFAEGMDDPTCVVEIQLRPAGDQFHTGLPIGVYRADVYPIAVEREGVDMTPSDHVGDDMFTKVQVRMGRAERLQPIDQGAGAEHIN